MELDNNPMPMPAPGPMPEPAPAPAPAPMPMPAPAPLPAPESKFSSGGFLGGAFDGVSLTDVGMIAITACAAFYIIKYYRDRINYLKSEKTQLTKDVEELKANVQLAFGGNYKKMF